MERQYKQKQLARKNRRAEKQENPAKTQGKKPRGRKARRAIKREHKNKYGRFSQVDRTLAELERRERFETAASEHPPVIRPTREETRTFRGTSINYFLTSSPYATGEDYEDPIFGNYFIRQRGQREEDFFLEQSLCL